MVGWVWPIKCCTSKPDFLVDDPKQYRSREPTYPHRSATGGLDVRILLHIGLAFPLTKPGRDVRPGSLWDSQTKHQDTAYFLNDEKLSVCRMCIFFYRMAVI